MLVAGAETAVVAGSLLSLPDFLADDFDQLVRQVAVDGIEKQDAFQVAAEVQVRQVLVPNRLVWQADDVLGGENEKRRNGENVHLPTLLPAYPDWLAGDGRNELLDVCQVLHSVHQDNFGVPGQSQLVEIPCLGNGLPFTEMPGESPRQHSFAGSGTS